MVRASALIFTFTALVLLAGAVVFTGFHDTKADAALDEVTALHERYVRAARSGDFPNADEPIYILDQPETELTILRFQLPYEERRELKPVGCSFGRSIGGALSRCRLETDWRGDDIRCVATFEPVDEKNKYIKSCLATRWSNTGGVWRIADFDVMKPSLDRVRTDADAAALELQAKINPGGLGED